MVGRRVAPGATLRRDRYASQDEEPRPDSEEGQPLVDSESLELLELLEESQRAARAVINGATQLIDELKSLEQNHHPFTIEEELYELSNVFLNAYPPLRDLCDEFVKKDDELIRFIEETSKSTSND